MTDITCFRPSSRGQRGFGAGFKPPKTDLSIPAPYVGSIDDIKEDVIKLVGSHFGDRFCGIDSFCFAVTGHDVLNVLKLFIKERLFLFLTEIDWC